MSPAHAFSARQTRRRSFIYYGFSYLIWCSERAGKLHALRQRGGKKHTNDYNRNSGLILEAHEFLVLDLSTDTKLFIQRMKLKSTYALERALVIYVASEAKWSENSV